MVMPRGRKKAEPGETGLKKKSFWSVPRRRWSRFFASSIRLLYSSMSFLSGKVTPYTRCTEQGHGLAGRRLFDVSAQHAAGWTAGQADILSHSILVLP